MHTTLPHNIQKVSEDFILFVIFFFSMQLTLLLLSVLVFLLVCLNIIFFLLRSSRFVIQCRSLLNVFGAFMLWHTTYQCHGMVLACIKAKMHLFSTVSLSFTPVITEKVQFVLVCSLVLFRCLLFRFGFFIFFLVCFFVLFLRFKFYQLRNPLNAVLFQQFRW